MDDPNGKGAIVDVTRIAPFIHESTQIQDSSKIFAAAESYKKKKYQEASAYENAVSYPFMTRFGGLGNDAKKFLRRMKAVALAKGRYRPGIDQLNEEFIKEWRENIACSVARAKALNVHDCGHQSYLDPYLASFLNICTRYSTRYLGTR